jgi:hypothetical protein
VTDRSDRDVRYFPDVVEQIVGSSPDLDELAGRIVVVSGPPHSGRSTVLREAADDLRGLGFRVFRRRAEGGTLHAPDESAPAQYAVQGAKVGAAVLQVAGVGLAGNLIALAAEIATTKLLADVLDPARPPADPYVAVGRVEEAVRLRAQDGPLVLIVDDADKLDTPEVWWDVLFGTTLPRLTDHLPLLVVLGVERSSTAACYALEVIDKRLVPAARAEEVPLPPLDAPRIEAALGPLDAALLRQLRPLVQGRPGWLAEVWRTWRAEGAVVQRGGQWVAASDARDRVGLSLHAWVERLVRAGAPDGDAYWRAKEILETAALEGQRFTVEALAAVLGDDVEDLIDWIDDHLADPDGAALLEEDGFVEREEGVEPPELRCYRFRSAMVAGVLRQEVLAGTNGKELARRYAHAMAGVYRWSPVSASAWTISRLATAAGDEELAGTIWRRANRLEGVEAAARLARFLVDHLDVEQMPAEELAASVERLNGLTEQLTGHWSAAETLDLCRAVERAARLVARSAPAEAPPGRGVELLLDALKELSLAAFYAGMIAEAATVLNEAVGLSVGAADPERTANLYRLLANAEFWSGPTDSERLVIARAHAATALAHARRSTSRGAVLAQVSCLQVVAQLAGRADRVSRLDALGEAATLILGTARGGSLVSVSPVIHDCLWEAVLSADADGRPRDEERFAVAATRCRSEVASYAVVLSHLSSVHRDLGRIPEAILAAGQALRLAQGYSAGREGAALLRLAWCARDLGHPHAASFGVLAHARMEQSASEPTLPNGSGIALDDVDQDARLRVETVYRADRGASLLRETFGVDVAEIDALNERLGGATEDELRGYLLDIQRYCAR